MKFLISFAAIALAALPVNAGDHAHHAATSKRGVCEKNNPTGHPVQTTSSHAYKRVMHTMHHAMHIQYTGDVDTDFTRGMVPHHQGAVDMANVVLKYGHDSEIRTLAKNIIAAQKQEIATMKYWLYVRGSNKVADNSDAEQWLEGAMRAMHHAMHITYTGDADADFVRGMIPHHQGAIDMADVMIAEGEDPMLLELSRDIIRSQSQEIAQMKDWIEARTRQ